MKISISSKKETKRITCKVERAVSVLAMLLHTDFYQNHTEIRSATTLKHAIYRPLLCLFCHKNFFD